LGESRFGAGVDFGGARIDHDVDLEGVSACVGTTSTAVHWMFPPGWELAPAADSEGWTEVVRATDG
jgi:hypothetical protein